jgi:hypothetical protein
MISAYLVKQYEPVWIDLFDFILGGTYENNF